MEKFLSQKPLPSEPNSTPASTFHRLALNNCGINGREAARLIRSLGNHPRSQLHLNGNPLEDGVEDLCRAIALSPGPAGLHMDMVEFRHETNFVALMKALTINKNISFLSMAGAAPIPSADGPCGSEVCQALEAFFQGNKSVRYLDLSGYNGKLDEGQLAPGFARSLRGLAFNTTLTHLRIRNQNLHDDVGTLGVVIRQNKTLRMIDCQENCWNLTSVQFLSKSLKLNSSIVEFPFPPAEYERVLRRVVSDIRRQTAGSKAALSMYAEQEGVLRSALQRQVQELRETVVRNRDVLEANGPFTMDYEESGETGGESGWPSLEMKMPSISNSSSGLASNKRYSRPTQRIPQLERNSLSLQPPKPGPARALDLDLDADLIETPVDQPASDNITRTVHKAPSLPMVRSDARTVVDVLENPYHVGRDTTSLFETPPGALSPEAGGCSPADSEMPATPTSSTPGTGPSEKSEESEAGESSPEFLLSNSRTSSISTHGPAYTASFDMGPYFAGSGRDFVASRFRLGGLEAHEEE